MLLDKTIFGKKNTGPVIGYDLSDDSAQLSYLTEDSEEPETAAVVPGSELYTVPTVLFKREGANQWFFGREAYRQQENAAGTLYRELLSNAVRKEQTKREAEESDGDAESAEEPFDPTELLALFVSRSLSLLPKEAEVSRAAAIVFTVESLEDGVLEVMTELIERLRLKCPRVYVKSHAECFAEYVTRQKRELWGGDVLAFKQGAEDTLRVYRFTSNTKTLPAFVFVDEKNESFPAEAQTESDAGEERRKDTLFLQLAGRAIGERSVTAVYLLGDLFLGEWLRESLRYLCRGRRVFRGNNLFSKGACFAAERVAGAGETAEKTAENTAKGAPETIYLGKDKLRTNIALRVSDRGVPSELSLIDAGENWYDVSAETELYLGRDKTVELLFKPIEADKEEREERLVFSELPDRPEYASRVRLTARFIQKDRLLFTLTDMGFGELFPKKDITIKREVALA